jgi:hypothetical protein
MVRLLVAASTAGALAATAGCAAVAARTEIAGDRLVISYGGDGRGAIGPCG